ncbi:MAG: hypothetical protein OXQ89_19135 [Rhodospirillaceae bacterium]|nr:hypothetical protein [Rhodospirillaceae bacterium]MDD9999860.1 hypothetical protein [Rhodospirillaceae bacterium]
MKRWLVLCSVAWAASVQAQDRLEIEIVPVWVMEIYGQAEPPPMAIPKALSTVHEALAILGVQPNEYNISVSERTEYLECSRKTMLWEQECDHYPHGTLRTDTQSWSDFVRALPRSGAGKIILWMFIRPTSWPWDGVRGIASRTVKVHEGVVYDHWSRRECRVLSIDTLNVIAHELGHCFLLDHNEDDMDYSIDLMQAYSSDYDWLKDSNKAIVRHYFRQKEPDPASSLRAVPASEIIF